MAKELGVSTAVLNKYFFALYHVTQWQQVVLSSKILSLIKLQGFIQAVLLMSVF